MGKLTKVPECRPVRTSSRSRFPADPIRFIGVALIQRPDEWAEFRRYLAWMYDSRTEQHAFDLPGGDSDSRPPNHYNSGH
jgi:hypothetical protein